MKTQHFIARAGISVDDFCASTSIGRTKFYEEVKAGRIRVVKSGRRTIVPAGECHAWLDRLAQGGTDGQSA